MQSADLPNFAWGHACSRQDTLSGLAVKYSVTPLAIKMTNNLISDQNLQSRHIVYIPGEVLAFCCHHHHPHHLLTVSHLLTDSHPHVSTETAFTVARLATDVHTVLHAVSSKSDLRGKRGTFIYDMTACRELVLVTDADGSDLPPQNPDAKPPVPPDPVNIDALSRKLSRMLGRGMLSHLCLLRIAG